MKTHVEVALDQWLVEVGVPGLVCIPCGLGARHGVFDQMAIATIARGKAATTVVELEDLIAEVGREVPLRSG